jgi:hypothetical protein
MNTKMILRINSSIISIINTLNLYLLQSFEEFLIQAESI